MDDNNGIGIGRTAPFAEPPGSIRIDATGTPDTARLRARGEFDLENCDLIPAVVTDAIVTGHTMIILDLAEVTFIGAATVTAMLAAGDLAASVGATLHVENATGIVARILTITDVPQTLTGRGRSGGQDARLRPGRRQPQERPRTSHDTASLTAELAATSTALIDRARAIVNDTRRIIAAIAH